MATPIEVALRVADDIIATGQAHHVWLGIEGGDVEADRAETLDIAGGAWVRTVVTASPAAGAGLAEDDVIVAIDETPVVSMSSLVVALRGHDPGETVKVHYLRDGKPGTADVTLVERAPDGG